MTNLPNGRTPAPTDESGALAFPDQRPAVPGNSAVIHLTFQGVAVDLQVVDRKIGQIEQLIGGLLERGWAPTSAAPLPNPTPAAGEAPICPYHGAMKPSTVKGKEHTWYCPKKMADGSGYCKEKYPKD